MKHQNNVSFSRLVIASIEKNLENCSDKMYQRVTCLSERVFFFLFHVINFFEKNRLAFQKITKQSKCKVDLHTISKNGFLSLNEINAGWRCFCYQKKVRVVPVVLLIRQTMKTDQYFWFQLFVQTIT